MTNGWATASEAWTLYWRSRIVQLSQALLEKCRPGHDKERPNIRRDSMYFGVQFVGLNIMIYRLWWLGKRRVREYKVTGTRWLRRNGHCCGSGGTGGGLICVRVQRSCDASGRLYSIRRDGVCQTLYICFVYYLFICAFVFCVFMLVFSFWVTVLAGGTFWLSYWHLSGAHQG